MSRKEKKKRTEKEIKRKLKKVKKKFKKETGRNERFKDKKRNITEKKGT